MLASLRRLGGFACIVGSGYAVDGGAVPSTRPAPLPFFEQAQEDHAAGPPLATARCSLFLAQIVPKGCGKQLLMGVQRMLLTWSRSHFAAPTPIESSATAQHYPPVSFLSARKMRPRGKPAPGSGRRGSSLSPSGPTGSHVSHPSDPSFTFRTPSGQEFEFVETACNVPGMQAGVTVGGIPISSGSVPTGP